MVLTVIIVVAILLVIGLVLYEKHKSKESDVPQGLQVKNADGNMILDTNDRVVQFKGRLSTTTDDGSFVFTDFPGGNAKFFYGVVPIEYTEGNKLLPKVNWNQATKTMSWEFLRFDGVTQAPAVIFYGYV